MEHERTLPSLPKHFQAKMNRTREEFLIKRLRSKTASISSDTSKHIIGLNEKRSTSVAHETAVTVRKNNFACPRSAPRPL